MSTADRVATVVVSDPKRRNALSVALVADMVAAIDEIDADDDVGAIVITGAEPAFCAGADLSELGESREGGLRTIYEGFLRIARSPKPTIAAVNGAAVGAGMNLALCCDMRVSGASARYDSRFLQLGIHPGGGHTWMLENIIGKPATTAMVIFGEIVDGTRATEIGLSWKTFADDELLAGAQAIGARAAGVSAELSQRTLVTLDDVARIETHDAAVDRELVTQLWSMDQPAFAERLAAMKAKISGNN